MTSHRLPPVIWGVLSGLLVVGAYYLPYAWPLVFLALVPLFIGLRYVETWKGALATGLATGFFITGGACFWMFGAAPLSSTLGLSSSQNFATIFLSWFFIVLFTAPLVGAWALLVRRLQLERPLHTIAASALWVLIVEYLRMYTFNFVSAGPDASNPPFWTIGSLGLPLADNTAWLQLAALGGIWLLSFVAVLVSAALAGIWFSSATHRVRLGSIASVLAAVVLVSILPVAGWRASFTPESSRTLPVGFLSLSAPQTGTNMDMAADTVDASKYAHSLADEGASVVLLTEGTRFFASFPGEEQVPESSTTLPKVIGLAPLPPQNGKPSVLMSYEGTLNRRATSELRGKMILTPQGEYLIGIFSYGLRFTPAHGLIQRFEMSNALTNAKDLGAPLVVEGARASILFCFEIFSPDFARHLVHAQNADMLLVMVSHSRFGHAPTLDADTLRFLKVSAVEAGVPLVASSNWTPAYALDRYGRTIASVGQGGVPGAALVSVPLAGVQK